MTSTKKKEATTSAKEDVEVKKKKPSAKKKSSSVKSSSKKEEYSNTLLRLEDINIGDLFKYTDRLSDEQHTWLCISVDNDSDGNIIPKGVSTKFTDDDDKHARVYIEDEDGHEYVFNTSANSILSILDFTDAEKVGTICIWDMQEFYAEYARHKMNLALLDSISKGDNNVPHVGVIYEFVNKPEDKKSKAECRVVFLRAVGQYVSGYIIYLDNKDWHYFSRNTYDLNSIVTNVTTGKLRPIGALSFDKFALLDHAYESGASFYLRDDYIEPGVDVHSLGVWYD